MSRVVIVLISLVGVAAFGWPFLLSEADAARGASHGSDAPWLFAALLALSVALVSSDLSSGRLDAKAVAVLGVLSGAAGAMRVFSAGTVGLEPMFFLLILAGRVLGLSGGFLLGSTAMLVGAVITGGIGPWLPFQMLCAGWVAMGAAVVLPRLRGRAEVWLLAGYGVFAGFAYGAVMNLWFWPLATQPGTGIGYDPAAGPVGNLARYGAFYLATSLAWDLPRAALTAVLCVLAGRPVLATLRRGIRRGEFGPTRSARPDGAPVSEPARRGATAGGAPLRGRNPG